MWPSTWGPFFISIEASTDLKRRGMTINGISSSRAGLWRFYPDCLLIGLFFWCWGLVPLSHPNSHPIDWTSGLFPSVCSLLYPAGYGSLNNGAEPFPLAWPPSGLVDGMEWFSGSCLFSGSRMQFQPLSVSSGVPSSSFPISVDAGEMCF